VVAALDLAVLVDRAAVARWRHRGVRSVPGAEVQVIVGDEWDKPSEALKRIASSKLPEQFRRCVSCGHRHFGATGPCKAGDTGAGGCGCKREVLES
jgi:hypothetical protein